MFYKPPVSAPSLAGVQEQYWHLGAENDAETQKSHPITIVAGYGQDRAPCLPGTPDKRPGLHHSSAQGTKATQEGGVFSVCVALGGPPRSVSSIQEKLCGDKEASLGSLLSISLLPSSTPLPDGSFSVF